MVKSDCSDHSAINMLKFALVLVVAVCVSAQLLSNIFVDNIHGFRVEYDDRHDIVLMVGTRDCYIVTANDTQWDSIVKDQSDLHRTSEEIFKLVEAGTGVTSLTQQQAMNTYHSRLEQWQCRRKNIHQVAYTPTAGGN